MTCPVRICSRIPSGIQIFAWLATLWLGTPVLTASATANELVPNR